MSIEHIITLIITGVLFISLMIVLIITHKNGKIVLQKSQKINTLLSLNKTISFSTIQYRYVNQQTCNSKRQLDHLSIDEYFIALIDSNESFYSNIIQIISSNRNKYYDYIQQTKNIQSSATKEFCESFGFTLKKFLRYENRLFQRRILRKPQVDISIYCKATYTSPQGRNHYWKDETYNFDKLKRLYDQTIQLKAQRQTRQYQIKVERAKMTDSLRYDILKRDNFRCQICGSCASDGVKLHVDHIIPVAKGGQTIPSNLRTLCDRCNMGKRDKI